MELEVRQGDAHSWPPFANHDLGTALGMRGQDYMSHPGHPGSESDIFAEATMQRMQEVIPDCTTVTVSKAGHLVAGDNPAEFLVAVQGLLSRVN